MALKQYRKGATHYGYDPMSGQGIAFADPSQLMKHFAGIDANAPELPVDGGVFDRAPGKLAQGERDHSDVIRKAGQAGVGLQDLAPYLKTPTSAEDEAGIRAGLGIDPLEQRVFRPAPSTERLYAEAYGAAGLADLKKRIAAISADRKRVKSQQNERLSKVNENPWMTEASRLASVGNTKDFFDGEITNLTEEEASLMELYNAGVTEVNNLVARKSADFSSQQAIDAAQLNYLLSRADKEITRREALESGKIGRYLPEYLQAKMLAAKPETIETDDGSLYKWDPNTGQFVSIHEGTPKSEEWRGEVLSPEEAIKLGVPYGTTKGQAAEAGIVPETAQSAEAKKLQANADAGMGALKTIKDELFGQGSADKDIDALSNVRSNVIARNNMGMARNYNFAVTSIKDAIARVKTGANITQNEEKLFDKFIPQLYDNEATVKNKLKMLDSFFRTAGASEGGTPPQKLDPLFQEFEGGGDKTGARTPYLKTLGAITGPNGSKYWPHGLDVDVKKGQPVKAPVSGVVTFAGKRGDFGNQVRIRAADGREIWLSHFDAVNVKQGDRVSAGQVIALGGNTGRVYSTSGGDGSHVDITMPKPQGGYYAAPEVRKYLDNAFV